MPFRAFSALRMLLLTAAVAAGVAGCGGGGDDDGGDKGAATGEKVTITFWHGANQTAGKTINALVDKFNASQDRITVDSQIGAPSDGLLEKTTAALAGGKYPDVVYQFGPNIANLARSPSRSPTASSSSWSAPRAAASRRSCG